MAWSRMVAEVGGEGVKIVEFGTYFEGRANKIC